MGLSGHVEELLLPLLATLEEPPLLLGYCLGGTLALGAALQCAPRALVALAAPWCFSRYPTEERARLDELWATASPLCEKMGYVPMEVLQSGFWALDPARTVRKFAAFAQMEERSAPAQAFIAVEDWANGGPPLTYAAARELFEDFYRADMTGAGRWQVAGTRVDPQALSCPILSVRSTSDRIVPWESAAAWGEVRDLPLGHVGMIVSDRAPATLWQPVSDWLGRHDAKC